MTRRSLLAIPLLAVVSFTVACVRPGFQPPHAVVDLSPSIVEDLPVLSVGQRVFREFGGRDRTKFQHNIVATPFYAARSYLELDNHSGSHYDPPSHVIEGAASVDQAPLERFIGRARVIDFRAMPKDEPLTAAAFRERGVRRGDIVLAFVGYMPPGNPDELPSYAYLSADAAEYLATLPVKAFGTDMPSLGGIRNYLVLAAQGVQGSEQFLSEHFAFLSRDIPVIEGLVNLEAVVNEPNVVFVGFPLKIKDGNGAPIRAAALIY